MSALIFNDRKNIRASLQGVEAPATTFTDVLTASFTDRFLNETSVSKSWGEQGAFNERAAKYKELTGRNIEEDAFAGETTEQRTQRNIRKTSPLFNTEEDLAGQERLILKLKTEDPKRYEALETNEQVRTRVKDKAKKARTDLEKTLAGASPLAQSVGGFVGSIGAEFTDPVNLITLPMGAARGAKLLKTMLTEAGVNMAAEVARQPEIAEWQNELGHEYGWKNMAENVGIAGLFGMGVPLAARTIPRVFDSSMNFYSELKLRAEKSGAPKEVLETIEQQARVAHARDTNPYRDSPDLDQGGHQKSLQEVDAALREGRPIKTENLGVSADELSKIDTTTRAGDTELKKGRMKEIDRVRQVDELAEGEQALPKFDSREDFHPDLFPETNIEAEQVGSVFEASEVRAKQELAPENIRTIESEFDAYVKNENAENFEIEIDGAKSDVVALKTDIARQGKMVEAIRVCSIGGK